PPTNTGDRKELGKLLQSLAAGDQVLATRIDRLASSCTGKGRRISGCAATFSMETARSAWASSKLMCCSRVASLTWGCLALRRCSDEIAGVTSRCARCPDRRALRAAGGLRWAIREDPTTFASSPANNLLFPGAAGNGSPAP